MKNILFPLILLLSLSLNAQISLLNEGFETWPAPGWTNYALGAGNGWIQSWQSPAVAAHSGSHSAYSSINNSNCDNWLVSPPIAVTSSNYRLTFWEKFDDIQYYVNSKVWISNNSGDPNSGNFQTLFQNTDTSTTWIQRDIDLSAYQGDTVYIGFQYVGTWHVSFIDDVFVGPIGFTDGAITNVANPTGITTNTGLENIIVTLKNNGTTTIDTAQIDWDIDGQNQTSYQANTLGLLAGDSISIALGTYLFNLQGQYLINVNLSVPDDFFGGNDSIQGVYTISSSKDGELLGIDPEGYSPNTGLQNVKVSIKNLGINIIDSIEVDWKVNGSTQAPFSVSGLNLNQGDSDYLTIGQYNFPKGVHEISANLKVIGDTNTVNNTYLSYAAVDTFWESFEGRIFPPENWTLNFGTKDGVNFDTPPHGGYYYSSQPDSNFFGVVSDTLFTPLLNINSGDFLRFMIKTNAFLAVNHNIVWKDGATGAVQVLQSFSAPSGNWEQVNIDLSAAAGVNYIGIVGWSNGPGNSKFDLITSDAKLYIPSKDLGVKDAEIYFLAREGQAEDFQCIVKNRGNSSVNGNEYTIRLMDDSGVQLASANGVNIDPWEETTISVTHTFPITGEHRLYLEIDYPQDDNPNNNTSRETNVYVVPPPTILNPIGQPDYTQINFPFNSNGNTNSLAEDDMSQTIYLKEELPVKGNIYGFYYAYENLLSTNEVKHLPIKVWITQTDSQSLDSGWLPQNQLTLVYDDTIEVLPGFDHEMYIPFDQPFAYSGLDNIAIQAYAYDPEWPPSILRFKGVDKPFPGPVRTISVADYYGLDPNNPPNGGFQSTDFVYTTFVIDPILDTGQVSGIVYNISGMPLNGANVSVVGSSIFTTTDVNGFYTLPYLPQNTYSLTASFQGYNDSTKVVLLDSLTVTQDFYLKERTQVNITAMVTGSNAPSVPLANVKVLAKGYTTDSTQTDNTGNFSLTNIFGVSDYEITFSLYGYYDTTLTVSVIDSNINLGFIVLREEFISPFDVYVVESGYQTEVFWKTTKKSQKAKLQNDLDECSFSYTNEPQENVSLGNLFIIDDTTTITQVEIRTDVYNLATDTVRIDVFDHNEQLLISSKPFLIHDDTLLVVDIPNIVVYDDIYVMLHWENNDSSTHALCIDFLDSLATNTAVIRYPQQPITLFSEFLGGGPNMAFLVRVHTLEDDTPFTNNENLTYNIYRGQASTFPTLDSWQQINSSPISTLSHIDTTWTVNDSSMEYRYAIEAIYTEGNSEVTFSNTINWENTVGISDFSNEVNKIRVFPIPTDQSFTIELELAKEKVLSIHLYDAFGKLVKRSFTGKKQSLILTEKVSSLPAGIYFLQIDIEGHLISKRIVVSH